MLPGCQVYRSYQAPLESNLPRENRKQAMPPYVVEPPDVLNLSVTSLSPVGGVRIQTNDVLNINVVPTLPNFPISGNFQVSNLGLVRLGVRYGSVMVRGMTLEEAEAAITQHLSNILNNPVATVSLAEARGYPEIDGDHLITQDGTLNFGAYGKVFVAGMPLEQVQDVLQKHFRDKLNLDATIGVTVSGYNSKVYYIVTDGGGAGLHISRLPITGTETVLDAVATIGGIGYSSSLYSIWIARPNAEEAGCEQILPVNLVDIAKRGCTATNYQLLPGDRLFIKAEGVVAFSNTFTKLITPFYEISSAALLGQTTYQSLINPGNFFGFSPFGLGAFRFGGF
jgi:protein involved in polysaccharide export with SLBB domain